jgi:hypothetical protein
MAADDPFYFCLLFSLAFLVSSSSSLFTYPRPQTSPSTLLLNLSRFRFTWHHHPHARLNVQLILSFPPNHLNTLKALILYRRQT